MFVFVLQMQNRHSGMRPTYKCHHSGDKFDYLPGREDPLCPMNTVLVPVQSDFQFSIFNFLPFSKGSNVIT